MESAYTLAVIIGILIFVIIVVVIALTYESSEDSKRKAGKQGEERARAIITGVLRDDDYLFSNVEFTFDGRPAELDCVVVNRFGVFIIEAKNYVGNIVGNEDDYEWTKYKTTSAENVYEKKVKNPIKQVKRQIYLLSKHLKNYGVDVWVKGYALLINNNSPVNSEYILSNINEIDKAIHTKDRYLLTQKTVEKIKNILQ